jgi:hypothetical protein
MPKVTGYGSCLNRMNVYRDILRRYEDLLIELYALDDNLSHSKELSEA